MLIVRFAIIYLKPSQDIGAISVEIGGVSVNLNPVPDEKESGTSLLAIAKCPLSELPIKDDKNRLVIPKSAREKCEFAIESLANLFSVFGACARSLLSPTPCLALQFENEQEKDFLNSSRGIASVYNNHNGTRHSIPLEPVLVSALTDRLDGVALLAETYSANESGRYRELVRYFELAFALPFTNVEKKLYEFLKPSPFGYTREEIRDWISQRHPSSHADLRETSTIALTSDVRDYLMRMEQAALDVLFNKSVWREKSTNRRDVWKPTAWTTARQDGLTTIKGSKLSMFFRLYDEFDVYPKKLQATLNRIEDNWYCEYNRDEFPKLPAT